MHKFFDYLAPDLPVKTIGELAGYIRRFAARAASRCARFFPASAPRFTFPRRR